MPNIQLHDDYPPGTRSGNTCSCCGAGHRMLRNTTTGTLSRERIVDFGVQIDFEGFLMLCEQCVAEAAQLLGMVAPEERDAAQSMALELVDENARLQAELTEATSLLEAQRRWDERHAVAAVTEATA